MRARRAAAWAGALLGLVLVALVVETAWVATRDYVPAESAPPADAQIVPRVSGDPRAPLRLVVVGDSTGAGIGASRTESTVGGRLAVTVAEAAQRAVSLRNVAVSGARARDLADQLDAALELEPEVVVVLIGANDVTHLTTLGSVRRDLGDAVRRARGAGARVVVGTCPDMGGATVFPHPLRELAAWRGRAVAKSERSAVRTAGGTAVDLAAETGPAFRARPEVMLSVDRFHPSDAGYALWADSLAPATVEAATDR